MIFSRGFYIWGRTYCVSHVTGRFICQAYEAVTNEQNFPIGFDKRTVEQFENL